jgi:nucleoside-diphosphate-sugar epimerase
MKVLIIGGTGLLGFEAAKQLLSKRHLVTGLALPPMPEGLIIPANYQLIFQNYMEMSDEALLKIMTGMQALVFAAGIDERVEGKAPIYDLYDKYNVQPVQRLLTLACKAKITSAVILGSYFTYAARKYPKWHLEKYHPYIRARMAQQEVALSFANAGKMDVAVLELPYIFGTQPGRRPVWTILVAQILAMKRWTYYPRGGTSMVTVRQAGQAIVGAILKNGGGHVYPIGYYNMTWKNMLLLFHRYASINRKIVTIPTWIYKLGVASIVKKKRKKGIEMGLDLVKFAPVMTCNLFIMRDEGATFLGVKPDDINLAIAMSVSASLDALNGKHMVGMIPE